MSRPRHVIVIGGGFAGLSCAVALADRGVRVTVLEARRAAGGRASSFTEESTGEVLDNGQHLFMTCYHETLRFLSVIGSTGLIRFQDDLSITYLQPGFLSRLKCPPLPAPAHLMAGLLMLKGPTFADRLALLKAAPALRRLGRSPLDANLETITVTQWLDSLGQTPALKRWLWHPLTLATLNESPDVAPASLLAAVLRRAFFTARKDSCLGYATVGLTDLYAEPARRFIEGREGALRTAVVVAGLEVKDARVTGVRTREGEIIRADAFVAAVPPQALARIEPGGAGMPLVAGLERFDSSPILSVNLWLDRPVSEVASFDFAGVTGGEVQWLFNKERILGGRARHLAAVISAARRLVDLSNDDLAAMVWEEIRSCLPQARGARLTRSMVVRERTATFSATVATEPLRPGPRSCYPNLVLAGDWTVRGLPATIETAVTSGHQAAEILCDSRASSGAPIHAGAGHEREQGAP